MFTGTTSFIRRTAKPRLAAAVARSRRAVRRWAALTRRATGGSNECGLAVRLGGEARVEWIDHDLVCRSRDRANLLCAQLRRSGLQGGP